MKYYKLIILLLLIFIPTQVTAFEFITTEGVGIGQTINLSNPSPSEMLNVPGMVTFDKPFKIDIGLNRAFNLKELDLGYLAFAYRKNNFIYSLGFSQLGQRDFYSERLGKFGFNYIRDSLSFGIYLSYLKLSFGGHYQSLGATSLGLGASYTRNRFRYALLIDNLNAPKFSDGSEKNDPEITAYGELLGKGAYSLLGRISKQKNHKAQLGLAQKINISPIATLFWGVSTQPALYGGGVEIFYQNSRISYAASYHPVLGLSHTVAVVYNIKQNKPPHIQSDFK